jgi:hypothetical protein
MQRHMARIRVGNVFRKSVLLSFWWPVIPPTPSIVPYARWSVVLYLFLGDAAVRRAICISHLLRARRLHLVSRHTAALQHFVLARSGVRGSSDVGLRDICVPDPGGVPHSAFTVDPEG